jgi:hypothetical protein
LDRGGVHLQITRQFKQTVIEGQLQDGVTGQQKQKPRLKVQGLVFLGGNAHRMILTLSAFITGLATLLND